MSGQAARLQTAHANPAVGLTIAIGIVGAVNLILLAIAAADHSWVAFGIGVLFGPIANLVIAASLLAVSSRLRGWNNLSRARRMLILAGLAVLGAALDFFIVSSMTLHGC